jgi:type II secretory pathway pseudopilin PulG
VALLALMTIVMLAATAAAPNIIQQSQRQAEREAIIRGEEVADAIESFVRLTGRPPRSMEELLEGANPRGRTKKVRVLRSYAARDPLARTDDGEWRLVQPRGREIAEFQQALMLYMEGRPLPPSPEAWKNQARVQLTGVTDLGRGGGGDSGGEDTSANANVPFIGVASRSRRESVVNYFGIERHDEWVFTPIYR